MTTVTNTIRRTEKQKEIVSRLVDQYGIDGTRILFLNSRDPNEPWIPPGVLEQIARQFEGYRSSSVQHDKFIPETSQTVYLATVTDSKDRVFTRSGVAAVGEINDAIQAELDTDYLAQGRALSAALNAAGFNPVKSELTVNFANFADEEANAQLPEQQFPIETEAMHRTKDLRAIHSEATKKGLILGDDNTAYRRVLASKFGVRSAVNLNADERAQVINYLKNYKDDFADLPEEMREEELYV